MISRRSFLSLSATAAAFQFSGCSALDSVFLGSRRHDPNFVIILGAGLTGLVIAYQLRRRGIPFAIYESQNRLGGRLISAPAESPRVKKPGTSNRLGRNDFSPKFIGELGGEWFSPFDPYFQSLCRDLRVATVDSTEVWDSVASEVAISDWLLLRSWFRRREFTFYQSLPEALQEFSRDRGWVVAADKWSAVKYGVSSSEVQAKVWAQTWAKIPQSPPNPWGLMTVRVQEGSSHLTRRLMMAIQGIRPDDVIKTGHRLVRARVRNIPQLASDPSQERAAIDLFFETPQGRVRVPSKRVICTLPMGSLAGIDGIDQFVDLKGIENLGWSSKTKSLVQLDRSVTLSPLIFKARTKEYLATWSASHPSRTWVTIEKPSAQRRSISSLSAGVLAEPLEPKNQSAAPSFDEALGSRRSELQNAKVINALSYPFADSPEFKGKGAFPKAGVQTDLVFKQTGSWIWAGEHLSALQSGSIHGALESAQYVLNNYFPATRDSVKE